MRRLLLSLFSCIITVPLALTLAVSSAGAAPIDHSTCQTWLRLVDVSSAQGSKVNWHDVAHGGFYGAYIKTTQSTDYVNPDARGDEAGAVKNGLPYGNYDYAYPTVGPSASLREIKSNAIADARYFVKHSNRLAALPPVLDLENNKSTNALSAGQNIEWATYWLRETDGLTHRTATLYTGGEYRWSGSKTLAATAPLWVAAYPLGEGVTPKHSNACGLGQPDSGAWHGWSVWQYADAGLIYGVGKGDVDAATGNWWENTGLGIVLTVPADSYGADNRHAAEVWTLGSKGAKVRELQTYLKARGIYHGKVDAHFGESTREAVIKWQEDLRITPDGEWGPHTAEATSEWNNVHHRKM